MTFFCKNGLKKRSSLLPCISEFGIDRAKSGNEQDLKKINIFYIIVNIVMLLKQGITADSNICI